jgi:hypothetical protein
MGFNLGGAITGALGGFASTGNPLGAIAGGISGGFGGGGGGGGQQSSGGTGGGVPLDFYAQYGAAAAQAQLPLTLAATRYGGANTSNIGARSLLAQGLGAGSMTALQDAAARGQIATGTQAAEVRALLEKGLGLQESLGQAQLGVSLLDPQFMSQAATAARQGDNELAISLGKTNQGLRAIQEAAKTNIAQRYAQDLGEIAKTRALTQGNLATGAQRISGQLALGDQNIMGNLTLNKARTESDLSRIRANTAATKDLRANAVNIAMAGQRYFG